MRPLGEGQERVGQLIAVLALGVLQYHRMRTFPRSPGPRKKRMMSSGTPEGPT